MAASSFVGVSLSHLRLGELSSGLMYIYKKGEADGGSAVKYVCGGILLVDSPEKLSFCNYVVCTILLLLSGMVSSFFQLCFSIPNYAYPFLN